MKGSSMAARMGRLPITKFHKKATAVVGVGQFFDLFDNFLSSVLALVLASKFHISAGILPLILGSSFLGMFFGATFLGRMADVLGRRRAFMVNLLFYSVFTLLGAFSTGAWMLIICRFLAGIGIGGEPPVADVYLSELLPTKHRGRYIAWAYTLGFVGVPVVGFLSRGLSKATVLGIDGWRWIFVIGALGAIIVWFLRRGLPESPRWLEKAGRLQEAEAIVSQVEQEALQQYGALAEPEAEVENKKVPYRQLWSKGFVGRTSMLYLFQIFQVFGYYGFGTLVPTVLAAKGYNVTSTLLYTSLSFIGYPIGSILSLPLVERFQRKYLVVLGALGMGVFGLAFGLSNSVGAIITFGFLYTLISNIFSNSYHIFQGELFPTEVRATATGSAYSLSRLMSGLMPFILLPVLKADGATSMFSIVAAAMVIIIIIVMVLGPKTTGRSLEAVVNTNVSA